MGDDNRRKEQREREDALFKVFENYIRAIILDSKTDRIEDVVALDNSREAFRDFMNKL